MFTNILHFFTKQDNTFYALQAENVSLKMRIEKLEADLQKSPIPLAGFDSLDIEPSDTNERIAYAAQVDEFHESILKKKLYISIAEIRELLGKFVFDQRGLPHNMTRVEFDFFLRGMEAGLWKIHDWATRLQGELQELKK